MKIVLASNNKDKLREIRELAEGTFIEIISQAEAGCDFEAEETGETFEQNSLIKAVAAMQATGLPAVADDSGLVIDALDGRPGVYSARYGGEDLSYPEKCAMLMKELEDKPSRKAKFVSSVACIFPNGDEIFSVGEVNGTIAYEMTGEHGFGYDPIFIPEGYDCSMACLTDEEKNKISHRGKAFRDFIDALKVYLDVWEEKDDE